jgi:hypothetical protein
MNSVSDIIATVLELLEKRTDGHDRQRILQLFRPLAPEQFAEVVHGVDLGRLLRALNWRAWGSDSRAEFLSLLEKFVTALNLDTKVLLANLLADGPTSFREEKVLRAIFLSEVGSGLTALKLRIDGSEVGHDLLGLLTGDIDAPELRFDILKHFRDQAALPKDSAQRPLRVVSDIDDTLYSSLKDARYPKGTIYKGVLELFGSISDLPPIFLTARPELVSSLLERLTHKQLRRYGLEKPTVLSGSLPGLMGHRRMAEQKARTLISYTEMYPEFRFVFFGDSGQGDMAFAESLLATPESVIERAFIHRLSGAHAGAKTSNTRIHLYSDYAEAAEQMFALGYLPAESLSKVTGLVRSTI